MNWPLRFLLLCSVAWGTFAASVHAQISTAGALFVNLDPTNAALGSLAAITNSGTLGGFFEARGGGATVPTVVLSNGTNGVRGIQFDGTDYMQHVANVGGALVAAPAGLVGPAATRSIEVWVFNPSIANEETLVAWGRRGGGNGSNMSFNYGTNPQFGAVGHWAAPDLGWGGDGAPTPNVWHHLVYTYDGSVARVYSDGVLQNAERVDLNTHATFPICLATQLEPDGITPNAALRGSLTLGRVRVHDGALTSAQVLNNFHVEKDQFYHMPGPVAITSQPQNVTAWESYQVTFNIGVLGSPPITYQWFRNGVPIPDGTNSGYRFVPALSDNGAVFSCMVSNTTNSGGHLVVSSNATLTVLSQPVVLKHRYMFDQVPGETNLHDQLGTANGTLRGAAAFTGNGTMVLGGTNSYANLPNNLVTGITSITIEAWVQDNGSSGWARIFDFGNSTGGEDFPLGSPVFGTQYMFLTAPSGLGNLRGASTTGGGNVEELVESFSPYGNMLGGQIHHVVWVASGPARTGRLFVDGVKVGENRAVTVTPAALGPTTNNWLGRSQYNDPIFQGVFDEFRIWEGPMTPARVAANYALGPQCLSNSVPPAVTISPTTTNVALGGSVTLCANITGDAPLETQWRRNGVTVANQGSACLQLSNVQLADGGAYTIVVRNCAGTVVSDPALVIIDLPLIQGADAITNGAVVSGSSGSISGSNSLAAAEPGEPRHFDKPGGKSVWYTWTPMQNGVATFRTVGSTFDTLLAVYVECSPGALIEIASDDDQDGSLTSLVRFNAFTNTQYLIAVDGFGGASGQFALSWEVEPTSQFLPVFVSQPQSQTVAPGQSAVFVAQAIRECAVGEAGCTICDRGSVSNRLDGVTYQWYRNGQSIEGATNATLTLNNVQEIALGAYVVVATSARSLSSRAATLQLNGTGQQDVQAHNKLADAVEDQALELGTPPPPPPPKGHGLAAAQAVVRGYTGTQVFNTSGGTGEPGDQPICGALGGASYWIPFVPRENGVLHLNTDGSSYNTLLAVFVHTNATVPRMLACDNNSGLDGRDSSLSLQVAAGLTNLVMVDGVNGQTGTLRLNYTLVTPSAITLPDMSGGTNIVRIATHAGARFSIQVSSNLLDWTPVLVTNSTSATFDYLDPVPPGSLQRFYKALMLP
jgi:hypothetical protein